MDDGDGDGGGAGCSGLAIHALQKCPLPARVPGIRGPRRPDMFTKASQHTWRSHPKHSSTTYTPQKKKKKKQEAAASEDETAAAAAITAIAIGDGAMSGRRPSATGLEVFQQPIVTTKVYV